MRYIFILFILTFQLSAYCQGVTQSAEGKSTVLIEGAAIGIDITKAELSFGLNTLNKLVVDTNRNFFGGGEIRVKNSDGIGNLFSQSSLVPAGNLLGYFGYYFSNAITKEEAVMAEYQEEKLRIQESFARTIIRAITEESVLIKDYSKRLKVSDTLMEEAKLYLEGIKPILNFTDEIKTDSPDEEIKKYRTAVKNRLVLADTEQNEETLFRLRRQIILTKKFSLNNNYYKTSIFLFGGIDAISFKSFKGADLTTPSNSFEEVYDRGGQIGIGVNTEWKRWRLGLTYAYRSTNNFSTLTSGEFTLRETNTSNSQSLISEEKISAYKGKFGDVKINELNVDVIYNLNLNKQNSHFAMINPYLRSNLFSRDTSLLPNTTNVGVGVHFYKKEGNFLGGFYVELPDVGNNKEKMKPKEEQKLKPPFRRLTFGIVGKISLKSVLSW